MNSRNSPGIPGSPGLGGVRVTGNWCAAVRVTGNWCAAVQVHATLYVGVSEFDNNKMSNEGPFKFKDLPFLKQKAF